MSLIDDIKRDREAGTPGPWASGHYDDIGDEVEIQTYEGEYVASIDCDGAFEGNIAECIYANSRRIARVPDMEASLLAADELAAKVDAFNAGRLFTIAPVLSALAAYRKATEAQT
jgi:hypothetical protein